MASPTNGIVCPVTDFNFVLVGCTFTLRVFSETNVTAAPVSTSMFTGWLLMITLIRVF